MSRSVLPSEGCVFRLDSQYGYKQQFPMTFNDVGLSAEGFEFNGSSSYITHCPIVFSNGDAFSLEWDMTLDASANPQFIIPFGVADSLGDAIYIRNNYSDGVVFRGSDGNRSEIIETPGLTDGSKHNLILTVSSSNVLTVYIDGVPLAETRTIGDSSITFNSLGYAYTNLNYLAKGSIKSASIYNRALTAQEVADRYRKTTMRVE